MSIALTGLALLATAFAGWRAWRRLRYFLHLFQLEGYKPREYGGWIGTHRHVVLRRSHLAGLALLALGAAATAFRWPAWIWLLVMAGWPVAFASSRLYRSTQPKKPLAYTARMKRLLTTAVILTAVPAAVGAMLGLERGAPSGWLPYLAGLWLADLGAPLWVLLAGYLMRPVEARIQAGFKRQARRTLARRPDLTVIGITGSYGKTSTKFIIAEILRQRYSVLASPGSYNTPMGLCLVINTMLKPEHQILVLEYGIRYRGDIQELTAIAAPDVAVVTTVGVAHLETMGSIENIALEKGDLVRYARPGATVVLNVDNPHVAAMAGEATGRVWRVALEAEADITARDIRYGPDGASFLVRDDTGTEHRFTTRLLGRHNILNILLGVAVGRAFGLRLRQIAHAVARVQPVEHRLQLRREGAITIIDDAFNSNPVGARNAVEILGHFDTGRRVIVTPGMVELGARQAEENRILGTHIARHADLAVLVGPEQTRPIREGLIEAGFPEDRIRTVGSLFEAQEVLQTYLRPGDVVLYENDLPDQYDES